MSNSFDAKTTISVHGSEYEIFSLKVLESEYDISR